MFVKSLLMFRATHTPSLSVLLDDLLTRDRKAIAKHLGVSTSTLARWERHGRAPRAVLLALFYESQWGYSLMECTAHNRAMHAEGLHGSLQTENAALRARIGRLQRLAVYGSANEPMMLQMW